MTQMVNDKKSFIEIAKFLDRPYDSVRNKYRRLTGKLSNSTTTPVAEPSFDEANTIGFWKRQCSGLEREIQKLRDQSELTAHLIDHIKDLAPKSYPTPKLAPKKVSRGGTPQSAVLCFSDTHIGKIATPEETLGLGNYNFELFLRRLNRMEQSIASILHDHVTTEVPEIVVAMIGDMIDGALAHGAEAAVLNDRFSQFYSAGHAIAQCLTRLSAIAPVRVFTAVGNHPRHGEQRKMPTKKRYSNLDMFLYAYIEALVQANERIQFNLDKQPFAVFDVQGHAFYAGHGDHLRGGDKILGVPNHAIGRQVSCTVQTFVKAGYKVPEYYLMGHFHRGIELPHALGKFIVNGGFPGVDEFGTISQFTPASPSQKFFLVHPKFGQTASYDLRLDFGDDTPHDYQIPGNFSCK